MIASRGVKIYRRNNARIPCPVFEPGSGGRCSRIGEKDDLPEKWKRGRILFADDLITTRAARQDWQTCVKPLRGNTITALHYKSSMYLVEYVYYVDDNNNNRDIIIETRGLREKDG